MYLYVILILLILYILYTHNKTENFATSHEKNAHVSFGRRPNNLSILDDSLFSDVITYHNDDDPYQKGGKQAIEKCTDNPDCVCVEYGPGHSAFCFPKKI